MAWARPLQVLLRTAHIVAMALVLIFRPQGIMGQEGRE